MRLEAGGRGAAHHSGHGGRPRHGDLDAKLTGGGFEGAQSFAVRIQPGQQRAVRRDRAPAAGRRELDGLAAISWPTFCPAPARCRVSVSPLAALDVPGLLQALDRYPYGCTEQTVSRAMPLLYVNRLAAEDALASDEGPTSASREAIERVLARQDSNGSFGLWSVGRRRYLARRLS